MEFIVLAISKKSISVLLVVLLVLNFFEEFRSGAQVLAPDEVEALKEIAETLGKKDWNFSVDPCSGESGWRAPQFQRGFENAVTCNCSYANNTICHVVSIMLKSQSLPGVPPPELVKLPYLQEIDLSNNYLNGSIPEEWGSMQLVNISLLGNRLSGGLPKEIGNITTLKSFTIEFNNISGVLPPDLGNLSSIERLFISSNNFSGQLPEALAKLTSLKDFRLSDNRLSGKIPNFIESWTNLEALVMQASGLEGPIPSNISLLTKVFDLRISDLIGANSAFPPLHNMQNISTLILKSCNIIGEIPSYLGDMTNLRTLDLSFNKLTGQIPSSFDSLINANSIYLTGNALTGPVPEKLSETAVNIDLSYNNFTLPSSGSPSCQQRNINLFGSSSMMNNITGVVPCLGSDQCPRNLYYSFHINCGGREVVANGSTRYNDDLDFGGASRFFSSRYNWAVSNTGNFMGNLDDYIATNISALTMTDYQLYTNARISALSLTYYGICLLNGNYTVNLHFAEIMFSIDNTYRSLGRRIFDIYIQGKLVLKDFNIEDEAGGVGKAVVKKFNAIVTGSTLEIRFYWAGKGTTAIPSEGIYGPLVSAISVEPDFKPPSDEKKISPGIVVGIVFSVLSVVVIVLGFLWWKGCFGRKNEVEKDLRDLDLNSGSFTLRQLKAAANNFDPKNKIGEGGFGPVYKGHLLDGTIIAIKQLSSKSKQGNREFVNEIGLISALQHPNLVKLYGCCIEGNQLLLVYEYMENNNLARALYGKEESQLKLDWPTRHKICVGLARALAYLHEESLLKIVHRDIKASNVLLDKDLNAKLSDFGLAKLNEDENSSINTRVAGTFGYMAPEYAMKGHLTNKADVYSFGVVALNIVSGRSNTNQKAKDEYVYILDWALELHEKGDLMELIDPRLESNYIKEEVLGMIDVALQCTNSSPTLRPTMSSVVSMLEGRSSVEKFVSDSSVSGDAVNFNTIWSQYHIDQDQSMSDIQTQSMSTDGPWTGSSTSAPDIYPH